MQKRWYWLIDKIIIWSTGCIAQTGYPNYQNLKSKTIKISTHAAYPGYGNTRVLQV